MQDHHKPSKKFPLGMRTWK